MVLKTRQIAPAILLTLAGSLAHARPPGSSAPAIDPATRARQAVMGHQDEQALKVLFDNLAQHTAADYVALKAMRGRIDPGAELEAIGDRPLPENEHHRIAALLYRAAGDRAKAAKYAALLPMLDGKKPEIRLDPVPFLVEGRDYDAYKQFYLRYYTSEAITPRPIRMPDEVAIQDHLPTTEDFVKSTRVPVDSPQPSALRRLTLHAQMYDPPEAVLGDLALSRNQPNEAVKFFERALNKADPTVAYRYGIALSRVPGNDAQAANYKTIARRMVLASFDLANHLSDQMRLYESEAVAEAYLLSIAAYTPASGFDFGAQIGRQRAAAEARGDLAEAIALQKQALIYNTPMGEIFRFYPMANVALYHRLRALDALARKDFRTLADAMLHNLHNGPPDADLFEKVYPAWLAADPAPARKVYDEAIERITAAAAAEKTYNESHQHLMAASTVLPTPCADLLSRLSRLATVNPQ
jgi:tetratricopeptide (TPR) repeat protein